MSRPFLGGEKMKAVLMAIHPKWCEKIFSGEKTIEARKIAPKLKTPFKVYVYQTKGKEPLLEVIKDGDDLYGEVYHGETVFVKGCHRGLGKVVGEFVCETVITDKTCGKDALFNGAACLTQGEAEKYSCGKVLYGLHIPAPKMYDTPKELWEFTPWCEKSRNTDDNLEMCCNCKNAFSDEDGVWLGCRVTRPPQSWQYVEELC